jgi:hypothetical protein
MAEELGGDGGDQHTDELAQVRKAIGDVADQLNNALTAALGNIAIAKMYLDGGRPKEPVLRSLLNAEALFPKIADLTQSLLDLSES